jgi:hypothetical protein
MGLPLSAIIQTPCPRRFRSRPSSFSIGQTASLSAPGIDFTTLFTILKFWSPHPFAISFFSFAIGVFDQPYQFDNAGFDLAVQNDAICNGQFEFVGQLNDQFG